MQQKITPFLWFDNQAEEAANFYVSVFKASRITNISHYGEEGHEIHGRPAGTVMTVGFQLEGQDFVALNGGPVFNFNPAISFQVHCENQEELDHYWEALSAGGDKEAQRCGWLKDRYGVSWQIIPTALAEMLQDQDAEKSQRVMQALLHMDKLDLMRLQETYGRE
jgi:predicted 3-demethylubiquinone-9 3-methyltransferase (glyoxalase superfamily)